MIETITELEALRARVREWKQQGLRVGFVPTMGNLHAGHYSLVMLARQYADRVVSSVFVNPTQFGPNEDFTRYPRTPEADMSGLEGAGCDVLWLPTVESMYPFGVELAANVHVPGVSGVLEGAHRPGHFDGVCTVVSRLFNQVQPDVAVFGEKDWQQLMVVRRMVRDLDIPVQIVGMPTARDGHGLALSSRNAYLSAAELETARRLNGVLAEAGARAAAGEAVEAVEADAADALLGAGFDVVDYVAIRRADDLAPFARTVDAPARILAAARIGRTRLIDNMAI